MIAIRFGPPMGTLTEVSLALPALPVRYQNRVALVRSRCDAKLAGARSEALSLRATAVLVARYRPATWKSAGPLSPRTKRTRPTPPSTPRIDFRSSSFHPRFSCVLRDCASRFGRARLGSESQLVKFRAQLLQPVTIGDQHRRNAQHSHKGNQKHFAHHRIEPRIRSAQDHRLRMLRSPQPV